jgi:hypothetical protein
MKSLLWFLLVTRATAFSPPVRSRTFRVQPQPRLFEQPRGNDPFGVTNSTDPSNTVLDAKPASEVKPEPLEQEEEVEQKQDIFPSPSLPKQLHYDKIHDRFYEFGANETIQFATLFERLLDTVEDAVLHARRIPYDKGWIEHKPGGKLKTVVVLGSGWGAHALMKVADTYLIRLIVVSPTNHFVFTPSKYASVMISDVLFDPIDYAVSQNIATCSACIGSGWNRRVS